jgi:hypothetical protein
MMAAVAPFREYFIDKIGGEGGPVLALDAGEDLPVRDEEGVEARYDEEEDEGEIPVRLPESEGILPPQEEKGEEKHEKEGRDDDNIKKDVDCPKFHALPLL